MNETRRNLLSIGTFAQATHLSSKALRLYARLGLLVPREVDPWTGYRYYHGDQIRAARLIRMLRDMDMPLAQVREILESEPGQAEKLLHDYCRALQERFEQAQRNLFNIIPFLYSKEVSMDYPVEVRTTEAQPILSITKQTYVNQIGTVIRESLMTMVQIAQAQGANLVAPPFGIYHGPINDQDNGPVEICVPVDRILTSTGEVVAREFPVTQEAFVTMTGDECRFPKILKGYDAVCDWITQNGYELASPPREIWVSRPGETDRMEIAWAFRGKG